MNVLIGAGDQWMRLQRVLIALFCLMLILAIAALIVYKGINRMYAKNMGEYIRQTISANPELVYWHFIYVVNPSLE